MILDNGTLIAIVIALTASTTMNVILFRQLFLRDRLIVFLRKRNKELQPPFQVVEVSTKFTAELGRVGSIKKM